MIAGEQALAERLDEAVVVERVIVAERDGSIEDVGEQRCARQQLDAHVEVRVDLLDDAAPPRLEVVDPADDVVLETPEPVGHDPRLEAVVAERRHRRLLPRRCCTGRVDVTPGDDGVDDVVAVGEDVGEHLHRFAECRLGGEGPVVDDRSDGFDDDSARAGGRKGDHVVGSSLSMVKSRLSW